MDIYNKYSSTAILRMVPPNTDVFLQRLDYGEKVGLSKGYWNPNRKMWVTMHFSEKINQPSIKIQGMYGNFFPNLSSIISGKYVATPQFSF